MISPYPKSKSGVWPYSESIKEVYEEFQIWETPDGEPITFSCDPSKLANSFGANPNAPDYLTPVYFKCDVLLLTLSKVLIDALNEKQIGKNISCTPAKLGGINKLKILLKEKGYDYEEGIILWRNVQELRSSGVAHLKGSKYSKLARRLDLHNQELQKFFCDLLNQIILFFNNLITLIE
ncbi:MAG: hypothetical protein AAF572_24505 [Cyanobacteria bacterium P01_B01_bin.77]